MCFLRPCAMCGDSHAWTHLLQTYNIEGASWSYHCIQCLRRKWTDRSNRWCRRTNQWNVLGVHTSPPMLMPSSSIALRTWLYTRIRGVKRSCCGCGEQETFGLCVAGGLQPFAYCCKGCIRFIIASWIKVGNRITAFDFIVVCRSHDHYNVYGAGTVDLLFWLVNHEEWFRQLLIANEAVLEPHRRLDNTA
jgi:hypothetical protein